MKNIFTELLYAMEKNQATVLATVVGEEGSVPRGVGSQMLISRKGRLAGTIGGGAVEMKAQEMAVQLLNTGSCLLHRFILRENKTEDIGMVCGGDVTVWFQFIASDDELWKKTAEGFLALTQQHRGGWLILNPGTQAVTLKDEDGVLLAGEEIQVPCEDIRLKGNVFYMPVPKGERVIIFGGGHIARALVPLLAGVDFRPWVFDDREEYTRKEDFPAAEKIICGDYDRVSEQTEISAEDYIVIMTNGHSHDFSIQEQLLRGDFAYMGVIGSRRKKAAVNARLAEAGIPEDKINLVHTPVGTDIRAVTPAEIAVSITGEMICVRAERRESRGGQKHGCPMH